MPVSQTEKQHLYYYFVTAKMAECLAPPEWWRVGGADRGGSLPALILGFSIGVVVKIVLGQVTIFIVILILRKNYEKIKHDVWMTYSILHKYQFSFCNRRGAWNKALSDFRCKVKFSFCFTSEYNEIWKENLAIYQKSLRAFFLGTPSITKIIIEGMGAWPTQMTFRIALCCFSSDSL